MQMNHRFFAQVQSNLGDIVSQEASRCGASDIRVQPGGVSFNGALETGYRFSLWSRTASRLLMLLDSSEAVHNKDDLLKFSAGVPWEEHIPRDASIMVNATTDGKTWITNSHAAALVVKDGIVDRLRDAEGLRPDVDTRNADITIHLHVHRREAFLYLDLSGESLHRRGYRSAATKAALKEHLAAAILLRSRWDIAAAEGRPFLDPFCGSGTLPIEAALIAGNIAPGLFSSERFGFLSWKQHDSQLWERIISEAKELMAVGLKQMPSITAWDIDPKTVDICRKNIHFAGLERFIRCDRKNALNITEDDLAALSDSPGSASQDAAAGNSGVISGPTADNSETAADNSRLAAGNSKSQAGMLAADLPYGKRSGKADELPALYAAFGRTLTAVFPGWQVSLLTQEPDLLRSLKLKPTRVNKLSNGPLQCLLGRYEIFDTQKRVKLTEHRLDDERQAAEKPLTPRAEMAAHRLEKNRKRLKKYLKRNEITCYRLYDADMPEFSAAVDIYADTDQGSWAHVQEYAPPKTIDPKDAETRLQELIDALQRVTGIPYSRISVKQRTRQHGNQQYTKLASTGQRLVADESGLRFIINLKDYLDSGIFLDHRPVRSMIRLMAPQRSFLNLFGYTGTATVYAAAGGATSTSTVDLSKTYLAWAQENMALNGFTGSQHSFIQSDVFTWLKEESSRYDLIFLDPPTFSNSKRFKGSFDTQRDHAPLIHLSMKRLNFGGSLIFSTNFRKFELDPALKEEYRLEEITEKSIPEDFSRSKTIHRCWTITHHPKY